MSEDIGVVFIRFGLEECLCIHNHVRYKSKKSQ